MKDLLDLLLSPLHLRTNLPGTAHTIPDENVDVAVIEVKPLYPDPEYMSLSDVSGEMKHRIAFGLDGPVVTIARPALDRAMAYAESCATIEVGGLCLGQVFRSQQNERLIICIEEMIQAEHTDAGAAYVTFTYATWQRFLDIQKHDFPDLRLLGWYHSHPGFGVFLSSMDRFIHNNFFTTPWHVAVVIESLRKQVGIFARHKETILPPEVFNWPPSHIQ